MSHSYSLLLTLVEHFSQAVDKLEMEQIRFNYSMTNIPIPPKNAYLRKLIEKVENVIKRMRWKAFFFEQDGEQDGENHEEQGIDQDEINKYGLNLENGRLRLKIWKSLRMNT